MQGFEREMRGPLGVVSLELPLISNLDVWANIALIMQYHENLPKAEAERLVLEYLGRFGMEGIARRRNSALSSEERFYAMLLRAAVLRDAIVLIDRPFLIMPHHKEARWLYEALDAIADFSIRCYIFDYVWNRDRYGTNYEAEN